MGEFNQRGKVTKMSYVNEKEPGLGGLPPTSPEGGVCVCSIQWNRRDINKNKASYN